MKTAPLKFAGVKDPVHIKLYRIDIRQLLLMEFQVVVDKMHFMKIYEAQIAQIHNGFNTIIRESLN